MTNDDKSAPLHVFYNEANEWYVATSAEDAAVLHQKTTGLGPGDPDWDAECYEFWQWPDDKPLTVGEEGEPETDERHTGAEWAAKNGRGFFFAGEP